MLFRSAFLSCYTKSLLTLSSATKINIPPILLVPPHQPSSLYEVRVPFLPVCRYGCPLFFCVFWPLSDSPLLPNYHLGDSATAATTSYSNNSPLPTLITAHYPLYRHPPCPPSHPSRLMDLRYDPLVLYRSSPLVVLPFSPVAR